MTGSAKPEDVPAGDEELIESRYDAEVDDLDADYGNSDDDRYDGDYGADDRFEPEVESEWSRREPPPARRYRPGRGGFDPEAAEIAARARYAFRQRVVLFLLLTIGVTAVLAGFLWPVVWWVNGVADLALVGYLIYLRRQVRIEEEIRQRRLARFHQAPRRAPRRPESLADVEVLRSEHPGVVGAERDPVPTSRRRRQAVVVDPEDEDPAFHDLDDPEQPPYRRAVGE